MKRFQAIAGIIALGFSLTATAQNSGFLDDYDNLTESVNFSFAKAYIAPGALEKIAAYNQLMIDQPAIVIADDSKYKGAKPQDIAEVSEALRASMISGLSGKFPVVNGPGEGAALISWAVSNIYLKKAKRGVLSFTPVGAVAYGAKALATDAIDKTRAYEVVIEIEATDSVTGEVLFAMVADFGKSDDEVDFESALALASGIGARIACRLNNAKPGATQENCLNIPLEAQQ